MDILNFNVYFMTLGKQFWSIINGFSDNKIGSIINEFFLTLLYILSLNNFVMTILFIYSCIFPINFYMLSVRDSVMVVKNIKRN